MVLEIEREEATYEFEVVEYSHEPGHPGNRYGPADSWEQPEGPTADVSEFKVYRMPEKTEVVGFWPTDCEWDAIHEAIIEYETGE